MKKFISLSLQLVITLLNILFSTTHPHWFFTAILTVTHLDFHIHRWDILYCHITTWLTEVSLSILRSHTTFGIIYLFVIYIMHLLVLITVSSRQRLFEGRGALVYLHDHGEAHKDGPTVHSAQKAQPFCHPCSAHASPPFLGIWQSLASSWLWYYPFLSVSAYKGFH